MDRSGRPDLTGWTKSSFCNTGGCLEVANSSTTGGMQIRNSNNPSAVIDFTLQEWDEFIAGIDNGDFE